MTNTKHSYLIDSDVFITAQNSYYAFDLCPGFWESLIYHHKDGHLHSVDRVKNELLAGRKTDPLVYWAGKELPAGFFLKVDTSEVIKAYEEIFLWVNRNTQFYDQAKAKFATGADGWLVAYAMIHKKIVVTHETSRPQAKSIIKLPDVCHQFKVTYKDVFSVLKSLSVQFSWKASKS